MLSLPLAEARSSAGLHGFKRDVGRVGRLLCFLFAGFFVRFNGGRLWRERAALAEHGELLRHETGELREQIELPRNDALR